MTFVSWLFVVVLLLPRTPVSRLFYDPKPWKYSSTTSAESSVESTKELAISTPDLVESVGLRCFEFGWGEGSARVSNQSAGAADPTTCLTCERYKYFEYAAEGTQFKFDALLEELKMAEETNQTVRGKGLEGLNLQLRKN